MLSSFGNAWVILGLAAIVILVVFFVITQDFLASIILTAMPFSIMAIANFEGTDSIIPYIIIILGFITAVIFSKIFSR
ncbi:hypothetical protein [Lutibacter sp.]|uniref:hypothetical protein n=1 Tax=Lutibacter sp. TaxID=1925666 RepID=UPI0034A0ACBB